MEVRLRAVAATDVDSAVGYYRETAGHAVAVDFVDDLEAAISMLVRHPHAGSLRFAYELEIPELRSRSLGKFPYILFYLPAPDHLDIWRLLHARQDIPASLGGDMSPSE